MIAPLSGWSWQVVSGGVLLFLEAHLGCAGIRYRERLRPLAPFSRLLRQRADTPVFHDWDVGPVRRLTTREGEYAVIAEMTGGTGRRVVAMVCGDDWYNEIDGLAHCPDHAAAIGEIVEELALSDRQILGHRRRRFVYTPPAGWHRYSPLPQHALWFPPGYPRQRCAISVYPALPRQSEAPVTPSGEAALLVTGPLNSLRIVERRSGPDEVWAAGLDGYSWEFRCVDEQRADWRRLVTILRDDRYAYPVFLDCDESQWSAGGAVLSELLASIEPLPRASAAAGRRAPALFDFWTDG